MTNETPKQEQIAVSPEQQAVTDLSARVTEVLNSQQVIAELQEDGSQTRTVDTGFLGSTISETTAPNGSKTYETSRLFMQSHDRGLLSWSWREGDSMLSSTSEMEVAGTSTKQVDTEAGIKMILGEVNYTASKLPEKAVQQKGRFARLLGKLTMNQ